MSWDDMQDKFNGLVEQRLGKQTGALFALLRDFGSGNVLSEMRALLGHCATGRR
jgi:hypothetical protein